MMMTLAGRSPLRVGAIAAAWWLAARLGLALIGFDFTDGFQTIMTQNVRATTNCAQLLDQASSQASQQAFDCCHRSRQMHSLLSASASSINDGPTANPKPNTRRRRNSKRVQHKDVVIVGGGLAGLSVALYLADLDPQRQVTILDREDQADKNKAKTSVASFAAAGMLAPQSERLPKGNLLDICMASKRMYPDFVDMVESMARDAGEEGKPYLWPSAGKTNHKDPGCKLEPWSVGYIASGGFLAPAFAGDSVATWSPPDQITSGGSAMWLDAAQVRELEPNLHKDVVGGWWFPEDSSVDARRLTCSLRAACVGAGVQFLSGASYDVTSLDLSEGVCHGLWLADGRYIAAKSVLVANGSWMRTLLPVPIEPHKGQSLSLRMPADRPPVLRRVLFAQDSYIVPKADGRIVIGATVEAGSYDPNVTPAGVMHILKHALQLVPGLSSLPMEETWAGLRPTTPDKGPILGKTPWENLFLAGGYWRNGVLLAPKTGELLASLICGTPLDDQDTKLLEAFAWDRFTSKEGGAKMAADSRFAASMYPVHTRKSGVGIAASVGTELGSYSTARSAREEREKDRTGLWDDEDGLEDVFDEFERAAMNGKLDAVEFTGLENIVPIPGINENENEIGVEYPQTGEDITSYDSLLDTDPVQNEELSKAELGQVENKGPDLSSVYQSINANKAKNKVTLQEKKVERPDPGFRIYHIDEDTGEVHEVPPYTSQLEFHTMLASKKQAKDGANGSKYSQQQILPTPVVDDSPESGDEILNGYRVIQDSAKNSKDVREMMRMSRMKNRGDSDLEVDESLLPSFTSDSAPQSSSLVKEPLVMEDDVNGNR